MKNLILFISAFLFVVCLSNCGGPDINEEYRMAKSYWGVDDYKNARYQIEMKTKQGEKNPSYDTEKQHIFLKFIDENNFKVVLDDTVLGVQHRADYAQQMFEEYRQMTDAYEALDVEDKYIYPRELVDIMKFGISLQIYYFKLGNEEIMKKADSPDDPESLYVVRSNEQIVISNFNNYLDLVNSESGLSPEAQVKYAEGINVHFHKLADTFPKANYREMIGKADLMLKKAKSKEIAAALTNLITKLESVHRTQEDQAAASAAAVAATDSTTVSVL